MAASELDDVLATMLYAGVTRRLPDAKKMLAKHLGDWATSEAPRIITKLSGEGFTIVPTEQVGCCEQFHEAETALADCQEDGGHILRDAKTTARWRDRCMAEQDEMKAIIDRQETAMAAFRSFVRLVQKEGPYRCTYSHDWLDAFAAVEPFMGEEV